MPSEVDNLPIRRVEGYYYGLIPSRFPPVGLYTRIASGRHEEVSAIAELYNPRLREKKRVSGAAIGAISESAPRFQNWNHAPFAYSKPEGSWFFNRFTRCLELSADKQTALAVSVAKRELFLGRTKENPIDVDMRMLSRPVKGKFLDALSVQTDLTVDARRAFGRLLLERSSVAGFDGVLFGCVERPSGARVAILTGEVLGNAVQCEHFRYSWDGTRITKVYCFNSNGNDDDNNIDPEDLRGERVVLAA